jgi:hypothetical protein
VRLRRYSHNLQNAQGRAGNAARTTALEHALRINTANRRARQRHNGPAVRMETPISSICGITTNPGQHRSPWQSQLYVMTPGNSARNCSMPAANIRFDLILALRVAVYALDDCGSWPGPCPPCPLAL